MPLIKGAKVRKLGVSFVILFRFFRVYIYDLLTSSPFLGPANSRQSFKIVILEAIKIDVFTLPLLFKILANSWGLTKFHGSSELFRIFHFSTLRFGDAGSIFQL